VIDAYNFQTFSPHHITFAMRKMEEEEEKKKTQNLTVPLAKPNMEKKETQANQIQQSHCCIL
jgi:hypothetical protein